MHLNRQSNSWSLRCSWSLACRRCSNYIFILGLTPGFNRLHKDNCKARREPFQFWDLVRLILEIWRYAFSIISGHWNGAGNWYPFSWKMRTHLSHRIGTMDGWPGDDSLRSNLWVLNSLASGRCGHNFKIIIFKLIPWTDISCAACKIVVRWIPQNSICDKSTLVQVMAWCCQATSHYLSQCWPRSMLPYGFTRPQWVKH